MKTRNTNTPARAMTVLEVILVVGVCCLLSIVFIGVMFPPMSGPRARADRINCVSNLKQVGLALRIWANDHGDKFPWQVPMSQTGTMEFAESPAIFRHFLVVSNELISPKVLHCITDKRISKVSSWSEWDNRHLSYFVGLEADESQPQSILSGDRNVTGGVIASNGILSFPSMNQAGWGQDMHRGVGNIGLGDGSAIQVTPTSLKKQIQAALQSTNVAALRFSIPKPN